MKYIWKDLPKPLNCFTVRNATMVNLNTGKIVNNYSANTKIVVVQKCVTEKGTYYRTSEAAYNYLNYAFRASAFGLPDEKAPPVPSDNSMKKAGSSHTNKPAEKQTVNTRVVLPKGGERTGHLSWLKRIFRRKNG